MSKKIKIIYIMGCGRSGTTIMDILLGNHAGFLSVGELNNAQQAWNEDKTCSCGISLKKCGIWEKVGENWFIDDQNNKYYDIMKRQKDIERQFSIVKHMVGFYDQSIIDSYHSLVHDIFKLLQIQSSAKAIIDSSKSIGRGLVLLKNTNLDVRVIHLVRDPRGVYSSFQKKNLITPTMGILSLAFYWNSVNLFASLLKFKFGNKKFLRICYEDLVINSDNVLDQIGNFIEEDLSDVKIKLKDEVPMDRGHLASGNRVRNQNVALILQPDFKWKKSIKFHQRIFVEICCFPLMLAYKYFGKNMILSKKMEN